MPLSSGNQDTFRLQLIYIGAAVQFDLYGMCSARRRSRRGCQHCAQGILDVQHDASFFDHHDRSIFVHATLSQSSSENVVRTEASNT